MDYSYYEEELSESDSDQDDQKRDPDFDISIFKKKRNSTELSNRKMVPSRPTKLKGNIKPQNFIVYSFSCVGTVKEEVDQQGTSLVVETSSGNVENTHSVLLKNDRCTNNKKERTLQLKTGKLDPLDLNASVKVEECQMNNSVKLKESPRGSRENAMDTAHPTLINLRAKDKKEKLTPIYDDQGYHGNRKPICKICGKVFTRAYAFRDHKYQHTGQRPYECKICHKTFSARSYLLKHKRCHSLRRYKCDVCDFTSIYKSSVWDHKHQHTGQRPYECKTCHKTFYAKRCLLVHERCHSLRRYMYKCDVCDFTSIHKSSVRGHKLNIHEKVRSKQCEVCGQSFFSACNLKRHYNTHTTEKPYKCDVCGAGFKTSSYLRKHSLKHTGEKKYVCDICGKRLSTTMALKQHIRIHTNEKPYKCKLCEASFTQETARNRHYVTHSKEKPYQCDICLMKFTQKCSVSRHKKVSH